MSACPEMRVLFAAPAGAKRGFGHLLRCRSLARALGVRPLVAVRGPQATVDVALRLGCDVVTGSAQRLVRALQPDVVVVDDPVAQPASRWIAAARAAGALVVSIHDLGLGCLDADLLIDGSVATSQALRSRCSMTGPAFAILDPGLIRRSLGEGGSERKRAYLKRSVPTRVSAFRPSVLISLGGGPRAELACAIASEIADRAPDVEIRVVGGFVSPNPPRGLRRGLPPNVTWLGASTNLPFELTRADVAVVGGGVSLYEACALGTPAVGVPVVAGQRPTVAGFVAKGAALGFPRTKVVPRRVADATLSLLRQRRLRRYVTRAARRLVDGRGAMRAAHAITRLVRER
jgi:spore coat polysaccharide biosynthesis predicted glycosyltransferase SpsG